MVFRGGEGEITEKKSRFIATVRPVKSEEEAAEFIEAVKKKYWDARHNCYAYVIGDNQDIQRYSDDGEPGGTAGRPMLDVLLGEGIHDTAVVVTRYFGGILLGTGGLVRAYQGAAKEGLSSSLVITRIQGVKLKITTDYTGLGKIQYILGERGIPVLDSSYTEKVELTALVPEDRRGSLEEELTDGTNGKALLEEAGKCFYGDIEGKIQVLE
ncbi:YigZ family protein [Lachnoclostridium sp. An118]|uniref:YigZ family protein n=1 Tax=Lachnoclostridium sp. An118 TaxID=1965547 RepID=UPI000B39F1B7|nr:YigZ family protein [Lachnoclostridium sp. An118]OUQ48200.1 YigZ family protein [Lachnoclostridium sp. An118]HJA44299.1 YigZ family protein [Candidatus Dorea stercoravium]